MTIDMFASPSTALDGPRTTEHHQFPLPPRLRPFEPERDRFGRYVLPNPVTGKTEGGTRMTTLADTLDDTYNLDQWRRRKMLEGLKSRPDLLENIDLYGEWRDVNRDLDTVAESAMVAAGTAHGREYGTAVHEWLEVIDADALPIDVDLPPQFLPQIGAYRQQLDEHGIVPIPEYVERIVRNEHRRVTGTFDRIYRLGDGSLCIGDVKTGRDLSYSYMAISAQMAGYADAEYILSLDGTAWEPMPMVRKDYAVVLHVPSDGDAGGKELATVVTIDLEFGRRVLDYANNVRDMRTKAKKAVPNQWTLPPAPKPVAAPPTPAPVSEPLAPNGMFQWAYDQLRAQVFHAESQEQLAALWQANSQFWTEELTTLGNAALARAQGMSQVNPWS